MILIQSSRNDISTNDVINWLLYYKAEYVRINENTQIQNIRIENKKFGFLITKLNGDFVCIKSEKIGAYWYRRGQLKISYEKLQNKWESYRNAINEYQFREIDSLSDILYNRFCKIKGIGDFKNNSLSKVEVLSLARSVGLKVPDTVIVSSKIDLITFYEKHKKSGIITKAIFQGFGLVDKEKGMYIAGYTEIFYRELIEKCPSCFFPTLFQENILKKIEIRVFYLDGKMWASCIFSQSDEKTQCDFRNYNTDKPNRTPPFKLPRKISFKISKLMKAIGINSGSIDLIYTKSNQFIFLEVNPIGQFWQVSNPCNYYLEKEIAKTLIKYDARYVFN